MNSRLRKRFDSIHSMLFVRKQATCVTQILMFSSTLEYASLDSCVVALEFKPRPCLEHSRAAHWKIPWVLEGCGGFITQRKLPYRAEEPGNAGDFSEWHGDSRS